ncbi:type II toxin-antitoxin system prevent-host-death family antitoxin [soil metagenome]
MRTVNIHEAKTHLSKLVEQAAKGESFVIAKAGRPMVKVTSLEPVEVRPVQRIGFMAGQFKMPEDWDSYMKDEIIEMFENSEIFPK